MSCCGNNTGAATCGHMRNVTISPSRQSRCHAAGQFISASGLLFYVIHPILLVAARIIRCQSDSLPTLLNWRCWCFLICAARASGLRRTCSNSICIAFQTTSKFVLSSISSKSHIMILLVSRLSQINQCTICIWQKKQIWAGTLNRAYDYDTNPHAKSTYLLLWTNSV